MVLQIYHWFIYLLIFLIAFSIPLLIILARLKSIVEKKSAIRLSSAWFIPALPHQGVYAVFAGSFFIFVGLLILSMYSSFINDVICKDSAHIFCSTAKFGKTFFESLNPIFSLKNIIIYMIILLFGFSLNRTWPTKKKRK